MKKLLGILSIILAVASCQSTGDTSTTDKSSSEYYFVTKLGSDTLAVERIRRSTSGISADVILRSPRISLRSYTLAYDNDRKLTSMFTSDNTTIGTLENGLKNGTLVYSLEVDGDSLMINTEGRNGPVSYKVINDRPMLPFIDMVHWPFDLAFQQSQTAASDSIHQYMLSGRRASDFIIHKTGSSSYTLRHPSRGVMEVITNREGGLEKLDAKATTRKLIVNREDKLNFDELVSHFVNIDKNGSPFGDLSGAIVGDFSFKNTDFQVTYGSPAKRGRDIFGGIVTYGELWRTGANRATHFKTSRAITIDGKRIPAGEYTFFTIPEANGGTLIINSQTGQNGRSYNESRDFLRTAMSRSSQESVTEQFTIEVIETETGGSIQLIWDQTVYSVHFTF